MKLSEFAGENGIFVDGDWVEKKDQDFNGSVRLIQLADVGAGHFLDKSNKHLTSSKAKELNCTYLHKGDILIARLGEPLCKACIFPYDGHYITAVDIAILRIGINEVNPNYLVYLMNSPWFKEQIKPYESGTTRKRISRKNLNRIDINIPSIEIQITIVKQIEESLSQLDSAVATLKKTKQQLEIYRQAVLKEAFEGNYPCIALSEISQAISGYAFKSKLYSKNGKYRVVKIGNVKPFHFDFTRDDTHTDEVNEKIISKYLLKQGDCIITQTGSRGKRDYGFVSMIEDEDNYLLNQRVAALRFNQAVAYPKFFQYYLSSKIFRDVFFSYETGNVGQGNVGIKALTEPLVILPSISQQVQIVNRIESQLSLCYSIEKTVTQSLQKAEVLRQGILKQAFEEDL